MQGRDTADVVVVGAGHAGCEAALAAARLGRTVTMVTLALNHVGRLSCNPAVGGLAKGHLVREIDALGGAMGQVADATSIQFRRLNTRRGLAVQASRAQVDIHRYPTAMAARLQAQEGLSLVEGEVVDLVLEGGHVRGAVLGDGRTIKTNALILTTGTFLSAVMHCGASQTKGGRLGDSAAEGLSARLISMGLRLGRLKTGTTPRLDGRTIDWDQLERQDQTLPSGHFSFTPPATRLPQIDCHIAHTVAQTHQLIRDNLDRSPIFGGQIEGRGPRYCPSIEDKVVRFGDRDAHKLFLEPEGLDTHRVYVNGLSTSLPADVQLAMVRSIPGLAKAEILQHGYAVEYDFADPRDLDHGLQHRAIPGLFLAGQVNGTSGYEEAAAQGLVAGVSAATGSPFHLGRDEAYIGVLIDDLVTRGVGGEPYRMFPSRAEHRLILREDNADRRLMPRAWSMGLIEAQVWSAFQAKLKAIEEITSWCHKTTFSPNAETRARFEILGLSPPKNKLSLAHLLRRPEVDWNTVVQLTGDASVSAIGPISPAVANQVVTDLKYAGYLKREAARVAQARKMEAVCLPPELDFKLPGISHEIAERLVAARPQTLGAAARLPGITPAAIDVLAVHLARR